MPGIIDTVMLVVMIIQNGSSISVCVRERDRVLGVGRKQKRGRKKSRETKGGERRISRKNTAGEKKSQVCQAVKTKHSRSL